VPKLVDHEDRRAHIAAALIRVVAARGLAAVSLRQVAVEAGVSAGMVQHYFPTKTDMVAFAVRQVGRSMAARLVDVCASKELPPRAVARAVLLELLPFDDTRGAEATVALELLAEVAVTHTMDITPFLSELHRCLADCLRDAGAELDPDVGAWGLIGIAHGLSRQVLVGGCAPELALAAFDAHLDLVFGPSTVALG
jgi:AcrR family transcriptional regulator